MVCTKSRKGKVKGVHVVDLFHGNKTDLEDSPYSIFLEASSDEVEGCFIHLSQEPRRNEFQNHPTKLPSEVQIDFSHT